MGGDFTHINLPVKFLKINSYYIISAHSYGFNKAVEQT